MWLFSKTYPPSLSDGAFDDSCLKLVIANEADFMMESVYKFDVMIIDSTDPMGRERCYLPIIFTGTRNNFSLLMG